MPNAKATSVRKSSLDSYTLSTSLHPNPSVLLVAHLYDESFILYQHSILVCGWFLAFDPFCDSRNGDECFVQGGLVRVRGGQCFFRKVTQLDVIVQNTEHGRISPQGRARWTGAQIFLIFACCLVFFVQGLKLG